MGDRKDSCTDLPRLAARPLKTFKNFAILRLLGNFCDFLRFFAIFAITRVFCIYYRFQLEMGPGKPNQAKSDDKMRGA